MPVLPTEKQELFAQGLARGLKPSEAAKEAGFSGTSLPVTASRLAHDALVRLRVSELKLMISLAHDKAEANQANRANSDNAALVVVERVEFTDHTPAPVSKVEAFVHRAVRERQYRLTRIQDALDRVVSLIDQRAAHGREIGEAGAPGVDTGLLVRKVKSVRRGSKSVLIDEYSYDSAVLAELRELLKHGAIEAGEWQEEGRVLPPATVDVSDLTDEQLFEEQRILREARERLEANRAGKPPVKEIQAAPGSVEDVQSESEVEASVEVIADNIAPALDGPA